jgi:hypothetical protein
MVKRGTVRDVIRLVLLKQTERIDTLTFNELPDGKPDLILNVLVSKLSNDGSTSPEEAAEFVVFERGDKDLRHGTQERETVDAIRVDDVLEALRDRLGDVLD